MKNLIKINSITWVFVTAISLTSIAQTTTPATNTKKDAQERNEDKFKDVKDADLLVEAYSSGMAEIKLAESVKERTVSTDVQALAAAMISEHTDLNNQFRELASKKNISLPTELTQSQQAEIDALGKKSGMDLDDKYVNMLVVSHKKSVNLFEKGAKCEDSEISALFAAGLPKVKEHLTQATELQDRMKIKEQEIRRSDMN